MSINLQHHYQPSTSPASVASSVVSAFSSVGSVSTTLSSAQSTPELKLDNQSSSNEESKAQFVEALVDSAMLIIQTIWPMAAGPNCRSPKSMPLRRFIQETLKRSRTSYSTFQVSLYYLILLKPHVGTLDLKQYGANGPRANSARPLCCGRRTFLTALILASKYLQDKNYSLLAWSRISGLSVNELKRNEFAFLKAVDWKLHIRHDIYTRWSSLLLSSASEDGSVWVSKVKSISPLCELSDDDDDENNDNDNDNDDHHPTKDGALTTVWQFVDLEPPAILSTIINNTAGPLSPANSDAGTNPSVPAVHAVTVKDVEPVRAGHSMTIDDVLSATAVNIDDVSPVGYLATPAMSEHGMKRSLEEDLEDFEIVAPRIKRIHV